MQIAFQLDTIFGRRRFHFHVFFLGSFQKKKANPCPILDRWRRKMDVMDTDQNTCCRTRLWQEALMCLKKQKERPPQPQQEQRQETPNPRVKGKR